MYIPSLHLDAFSNRPFTRDPAAVCLLQGCLDDAMLRKVAAENNLSEVAFLLPVGGPYDLRGASQSHCQTLQARNSGGPDVVVHFLQPAASVVDSKRGRPYVFGWQRRRPVYGSFPAICHEGVQDSAAPRWKSKPSLGESACKSFAFQEFACHVGRIAMLAIDRVIQSLHLFIGNLAR
jgi:hypothetical protein